MLWRTRACSRKRRKKKLEHLQCKFALDAKKAFFISRFDRGDFADLLGEDYLGLRELGIAAEFGMSSLTIPKKLLRGKRPQKASGAAYVSHFRLVSSSTQCPIRSKPKEPPPPYPPPPPFHLLAYKTLDDQIGLLKPYYQSRFTALAQETAAKSAAPPPLPAPQLAGTPAPDIPAVAPPAAAQPSEVSIPPDFVLPDDPPNSAQVRIGPLGQIMRPSTTSGSGKKKVKTAAATPGPAQAGQGGGGSSAAPNGAGPDTPASTDNSPKKKKGVAGIGTGNGRKKKTESQSDVAQSPVPPPAGFNQNQNRPGPGQGKGVVFPAVVVASA